jgi:hypothetical protein
MITSTTSGKRILKAFGYTVAVMVGPLILAAIIWAAAGNPDLVSWSFWGGLFLGTLAVLTNELEKRAVVLVQQPHEKSALPPVLTWNTPGIHRVSTETVIDLSLGTFALNLAMRTDSVRSRCILSQYASPYTPTDQITQN